MKPVDQLTAWVSMKHSGQLIKRSGEPYLAHLLAVANIAAPLITFGFEIGLCHDLLEKTDTTAAEFNLTLLAFDYSISDAAIIVDKVAELTDVFTKSAFPDRKKSERKKKEEDRLIKISSEAKTVKYADLLYNIQWMIQYDQKHLVKYLKRKLMWLEETAEGNRALHHKVVKLIQDQL